MHRARRLASVAVVASLAVAGLSACRSEPSVAAYVGGGKVTEARVQEVWDEVREALDADPAARPQTGASAGPAAMPITRSDVVRQLISVDVLTEVAKRENVTAPAEVSLAEYASALRLPERTEYLRLYARSDSLVKALRQNAQDAPAPTDADLREVFDVLVKNEQIAPGSTFAEFKTALPAQNMQLVQSSAAVRKEINEVTGPLRIKVNPRYQPLGIPVLEFQTQGGELRPLVVAPLGAEGLDSPVTDIG
jgi:hypothetical protein